jgi:glycosyltransferase involved in cell wall biosynthesis
VIEAFDLIARERDDVRLTMVADPWAPNPDRLVHSWVSAERRTRLVDRLTALEHEGRVVRRASAEHETVMSELYPRADAFVMPSLAEGFGFTNVEAMSMGLPVISSDIGPMREVIVPGRTGVLVPPGDVASLAESMLGLVADRDAAATMGSAARETFLEKFTIDRFRSELGQIYRTVLEA